MYRTILAPVDGSPTSMLALAEAVKLAKLCGARLRLLHVIDPITRISGFERPEIYMREIRPALIASGEEVLAQARAAAAEAGVEAEVDLQENRGQRTWEIILERTHACEADLIVLGTHGMRGVDRVLMGSDAEQVARHARVPVLLVRQPHEGLP